MGYCRPCRHEIPDRELLDHARVIHPDDAPERWPDGAPVIHDDDPAPADVQEAP